MTSKQISPEDTQLVRECFEAVLINQVPNPLLHLLSTNETIGVYLNRVGKQPWNAPIFDSLYAKNPKLEKKCLEQIYSGERGILENGVPASEFAIQYIVQMMDKKVKAAAARAEKKKAKQGDIKSSLSPLKKRNKKNEPHEQTPEIYSTFDLPPPTQVVVENSTSVPVPVPVADVTSDVFTFGNLPNKEVVETKIPVNPFGQVEELAESLSEMKLGVGAEVNMISEVDRKRLKKLRKRKKREARLRKEQELALAAAKFTLQS